MSHGMNDVPEACLCEACVLGRMKEGPHKVPAKCGTYPLEFIHTDIGGPFPVTGYKGERYWVTFLDDYTKIAEAYCYSPGTLHPVTLHPKILLGLAPLVLKGLWPLSSLSSLA